jgi:hypothetical protein
MVFGKEHGCVDHLRHDLFYVYVMVAKFVFVDGSIG